MRHIKIILMLLVFITAAAPFSGQDVASRASGLIPATAEELRGIPLASVPFAGDELPGNVDLSVNLPPPGQQGRQNSCVGWTLAYALKSYQERTESGASYYTTSGRLDPHKVFSPAFIYNQINNGRDGGCSFITGLNLLSSQGAATWADMPYNEGDFTTRPSATAAARARKYRIDYWRRVNVQDVREVKAQLNAGYPVISGVLSDDGFNNAGRGFVWRAQTGQRRGAHAILIVGYDDARHAFKLINSYGDQWGDQGYGWIDYQHFTRVTSEGYVAKDAVTPGQETVIERTPPVDRERIVPPNPPPADNYHVYGIIFTITNVQHNTTFAGRPDLGYFMRFDGRLAIPPGTGRQDQVVIHFYYDMGNGVKGAPVRSLSPQYADINGFAACGAAPYPIPPQGLSTTWAAWIPYGALDLPSGTPYQPYVSSLLAEPVLFIDNFGVRTGGVIPFTVTK